MDAYLYFMSATAQTLAALVVIVIMALTIRLSEVKRRQEEYKTHILDILTYGTLAGFQGVELVTEALKELKRLEAANKIDSKMADRARAHVQNFEKYLGYEKEVVNLITNPLIACISTVLFSLASLAFYPFFEGNIFAEIPLMLVVFAASFISVSLLIRNSSKIIGLD